MSAVALGLGLAIGVVSAHCVSDIFKGKQGDLSERAKRNLPLLALSTLAAATVLALWNMPYSYYLGLRVFMFMGCGYFAWFFRYDAEWIRPMMIILALVYNPFVPVHLDREWWSLINALTGTFFVTVLFMMVGRSRVN